LGHHLLNGDPVVGLRIVGFQLFINRLASILRRIGQMVSDEVYSGDDRREAFPTRIPAEDIVVREGLPSAAFEESDRGKESPI